jgi:processive 1,2-diacylglycerol beta-glucosyltransferase
MKKILVSYATAGVGHKRAALSIREALEELSPPDEAEVTIIDSLNYTNDFFRWTYLKGFVFLVNRFPTIWGMGYYITDNVYVNAVLAGISRMSNWVNSKKLREYLIATQPDVIVSAHFYLSEVVADLKRKKLLRSKLVTVVTDYILHAWWVAPETDMYVVGSEHARQDLLRWKTDPAKIKILGIPVAPVFCKLLDKKSLKEKIGIRDGVMTILVLGGGYGIGPIEDIVKAIDSVEIPVQIIAICGFNEKLAKDLELLRPRLKNDMKVLGFVDNVYEYMEVSDLLISKSGGITTAESLFKDLPMLVVSPILGQETRNCDFLTGEGAAMKIDGLSGLKGAIEDIAAHPDKADKMKQAIRNLRRPAASYDIAQMVLEMCGVSAKKAPVCD